MSAMEAKDIKACLKAAREAIRNKDYKEALTQCRAVLTTDKNNYNALVFVGVATEGLDQLDQAVKAYQKAAELNPEQLLAWQGLGTLLEKHPTLIERAKACSVYEKLESVGLNGVAKQKTFLHKLAELQIGSQAFEKAAETVEELLALEGDQQQRVKLYQLLNTALAPLTPELSAHQISLFKTSLSTVLDSSGLTDKDLSDNVKHLLRITAQTDRNIIPLKAEELRQKFPSLPAPVEFLLQNQLEKAICEGGVSEESLGSIRVLTAQLASLCVDCDLVKVGESFLLLQERNFSGARVLLEAFVSQDSGCVSRQFYLCQAFFGLHKFLHSLEACDRGLAAIGSSPVVLTVPTKDITIAFRKKQAEIYQNIGTAEAQEKALQILQEVEETRPSDALSIRAYIFLDQGNLEAAQRCRDQLSGDSTSVQTLTAAICYAKKEYVQAYNILKDTVRQDPSLASAMLLLGKVMWQLRDSGQMHNIKQDCFSSLMKAAKLDPNNDECFLYLGYFYQTIQNDTVKAKRCFQKAFDLNSNKEDTGCALVDALLELGEESQALKILEDVTSQAAAGHSKWAWLRLGLYQIKHNNPIRAIQSLQSALRADPHDSHVWECLADAYLQRGSLSAALKAFNKALELNPESLYCLYQIASIKHILGSLPEAIQDYKHILDKSDSYVPALKGVGESLIHLGRQNLARCLDGLAKDNFEEALVYLTSAVVQRPDFSCLWKLLGDAATVPGCLSADSFRVPSKLVDSGSQECGMQEVTKTELLQVGARCYSQAIKLHQDSGPLWHDLAVNLYHQSRCHSAAATAHQGSDKPGLLLQRAAQSIQRAIDLEPCDWRHWNVLGVIACCHVNFKPALAQHCFIKSIQCEASNVYAWTNLGALYLSLGETELAHHAFKAAQSVDPTCMEGWIGQALIAEQVCPEEAMDLFRHTTDLGFHPESALGYGEYVLKMLGDSSKRDWEYFQYCIQQMFAVSAASDALVRYTGRNKTNPIAYNMHGLLCEHQNLIQTAVAALERALALLEKSGPDSFTNEVRLNLARLLCKQGKYEDSVAQFEASHLGSTVEHTCIYGLALFKCGRYSDSFRAYQQALNLTPDSPLTSQIHTALGMVAYQLQDVNTAKAQLFDGSQAGQPSVQGLLALCALGLMLRDSALTSAVLGELHSHPEQGRHLRDVTILQVYSHLLEGESAKAETYIKEAAQSTPELYSLLAQLMVTIDPSRGADVVEWAQLAVSDNDSDSKGRNRVVQCLGQLLAGHHSRHQTNKNALTTAQKVFHSNPGCLLSLASLACSVHSEAVIQSSVTGGNQLFQVERGLLEQLLSCGQLEADLQQWSLQQLVVCCLEANDWQAAQDNLQLLRDRHPGSSDLNVFIQSLSLFLSQTVDEKSVSKLQHKLHNLVIHSLLLHTQKYEEAVTNLQQLIQQPDNHDRAWLNLVERALHAAYSGLQNQPENEVFQQKFAEVAKLCEDKNKSAIANFLLALAARDNNTRLAKHLLATSLDQIDASRELGYCSSMIRQLLISILRNSTKESDQQLIKALVQDAEANKDRQTIKVYQEPSV